MSSWSLSNKALNSSGYVFNYWRSIATNGSILVAVASASNGTSPASTSTGHRVMTSTDGINWTPRASAADNAWMSVCWGNNLFVAVSNSGTGNRVMTSPDGITWTIRTSAADNSWNSVTFGNNLFVAVASTGTGNRVMTSSDGITWTTRTSAADNNWQGVTFGNSLFVAVASTGTGNRVMTSTNGINWTIRNSSANNSWCAVCYGNGLFVAVAGSGSAADNNRVMYSSDGITWTQAAGNVNNHTCITYGNGLYVALAMSTIGQRVMTSPDAINWTTRNSSYDSGWSGIIYFNNMFIGVGNGSGAQVMTSPDGITWTTRYSVEQNPWKSITYGNNMFVAVAQNYGDAQKIAISYDGVNWLYRNFTYNGVWFSVCYGGDKFVAISFTNGNIGYSTDGLNWTGAANLNNQSWQGICYGNGTFVAVAGSGTGNRVSTSSNGINWTSRSSAEDNGWTSVCYGNNLFVAVANSGTNRVMTSPDGITWTARTASAANSWTSVCYGNNLFVAVSSSGVMTSPDGITWTSRSAAVNNSWTSVTFGNGIFVAVASSGTGNRVMTSTNGTSWTARSSAADSTWNSVAYGGGIFAAVPALGTNGTPLFSRSFPMYSYSLTKPTLSNFSVPAKKINDVPFTLTDPTSNSSGSFTYISSDTSVATISGNTVTIVGVGTSTIIAVQSSTTTHATGNITSNLVVEPNLITTTISATSSYVKTCGDASFNLNATTNNTETPIIYSSSDTSVVTVNSSGQVTIIGAGSATITLSQTETASYFSGSANVSITVNKITTIINATSSYTKTYGDASFNLNAISNNTETSITYSSSNTSVATVNSSGQVTIIAAGSATITLSQTATTNYNSGTANVSITVNKITTAISATSSYTKTYGDASFNLNATTNNTETSITYSSSNTSVATVNLSGRVTIVGAGSATITLSQTATTNYTLGSSTVSITVNKITTAINTISSYTKSFGDASFNLNATTNNTETPITYSSSNTSVATVNSTGQVSIVGLGSATITLSQTSTTNYTLGSSTVSIAVNKATTTISAISSYTKTYGDASFNLNPTSNNTETSITYSSDNTSVVTVNSSGEVTIVGAGLATMTLSQTETTNYNSGSKNIPITVNKATPTIIVTTPIIKLYEDSSFNLNATSNNNETSITYTIDDTNEVQLDSNGQVNIVGSGSSTITVSQIETSNYNAVSEFVSITVNKAITTISATSSHTKTYGDANFNLNATSNNTETSITYSSDSTSVATVNSSGEVTIVGAGLATITLSQTSTTNYSLGTKYVYLTINKLTTTITSSTPIEKVYGDSSFQLEFTTNSPETTYFESSNTLVATIDSSGNIVLIKPGTTDITIYQLSSSNYTDASLNITLNITKTYTAQELRDLGFTITEMKNAGYTATELKTAEFTASELKAAEFTATELKTAEFTATELKAAEFTATELKAAEFTASELKAAEFTASELKAAEFTASELKAAEFTATELKAAEFTATELKAVEFTATELKAAEFTATELKAAEFSLAQLYEADFTATELKVAEFTATQLKDVGYSVAELNFADFTVGEMKEAGFTVTELKNGNYTDSEILSAGFSGSELRISGYTVSELQSSGYTDEVILSSGFTTTELYISGYNINEIKTTGYTDAQILADLNTVLSVIPYPPIITDIQPDDSKVYVNFTDNSNNSFPILGYKYSLNNSTELKWFFTKQSPLTIFGLINGQSYSIGMYAVNSNGTSVVSNIISNITPSAVPSKSTIAVATLTNHIINAIFTVGNSNGSPITEYYYSLDQTNYLLIEPSGNTFTINNVSPDQSYALSMKTKNENGFSEASNTIIVSNPVLPQPVLITGAQPDDSKVYVNFIDNSNNLISLLGYKYSLNNSTDLKWSLTKQSPLTIFGLTNGESYSVGIYAVNINGDSIVSNIISNIVPSGLPSKPTLVSATRNGQTIAVEFTDTNSNGSIITEYYYSLDLTSYALIEPSGNFLFINNIQYNQNYTITIKTKNANGFSQISNPININSTTSPDAPVITNIFPGDKECSLYFNPGNTYNSNIICYKYIINNDTSTEYIATNKTSPIIIGSLVNGNTYTFKIKVFTQSGQSSLSNESASVVPYGVPLAPVITSLEPRDRAIIVNFTANNNGLPVLGIKYSVNDTNLVDIGMVTSPFTISNLTNKNTSTITIYSYNNIGTSIRSNTMITTPGAPTAPTITSMYVSNTILYINYTPSSLNNGALITRMYYTLDSGKINIPIATISNPLVIPKLQTGVNLNIGIVSQNSNGFSPISNIQNIVVTDVPSRPTIASITPVYESATTFRANVLLGTVISNGSPITGYKYAIGSTSTTYYDVSGTSMPLSIPGLPVNTTLVLKIRTINGIGQSLESAPSRSFRYNINVPAKIAIRTVTTSYELATVNFTKPAINGSEISTYKYSLNNSEYIDLNTTTLPLLVPIQNNVSYNIRIIATNVIGDSIPSDSMTRLVSFTYLPPLPPRISSIVSWNNSLIVNFIPSAIRGAPVTSLSYAIDSSQNIIDSGSLTSPITINSLTNGTKYNVMLFSNSLAGMSGVSNIVSGTPILSVPATPVITSITPLNNSCSIIFTPPLANGSPITTYKYTLDNGVNIIDANTNVSPILISNLVNGTNYSIRILATNSIGDSPLSIAKTVTPIYSVPSAPVITSVLRTSGRATVNFTLSIPNGSTISSYYYTFDNGSTYTSANKTTSPIIIAGLTSGTSYSLRLVALNDLGYSQLSNQNVFTAI
jgi:uncharacterized protein YjbI with pentapeptide repeats